VSPEGEPRADLVRSYTDLRESPESLTHDLRKQAGYPLWVTEDLAGAEAGQGAARQRVIRIRDH
jgi:hypothetical protein